MLWCVGVIETVKHDFEDFFVVGSIYWNDSEVAFEVFGQFGTLQINGVHCGKNADAFFKMYFFAHEIEHIFAWNEGVFDSVDLVGDDWHDFSSESVDLIETDPTCGVAEAWEKFFKSLDVDLIGAVEDDTVLSHAPAEFLETLGFAGAGGSLEENSIGIFEIREYTGIDTPDIRGADHEIP